MDSKSFFEQCNSIILNVNSSFDYKTKAAEKLTAFDEVNDFTDSDFVEDDFADGGFVEDDFVDSDFAAESDFADGGNATESVNSAISDLGAEEIRVIQDIHFDVYERKLNNFLSVVLEDLSPCESERAIDVWNFNHTVPVSNEEALCRAYALERYAVVFDGSINVSELSLSTVQKFQAAKCEISKEMLDDNYDYSASVNSAVEVEDVAPCERENNQKLFTSLCDGLAVEFSDFFECAIKMLNAGELTEGDVRQFILLKRVMPELNFENGTVLPFNTFLIKRFCQRAGIAFDFRQELGDVVLLVHNDKIGVYDSITLVTKPETFLKLENTRVKVLNDNAGVIFYGLKDEATADSLLGYSIRGRNSLQVFADENERTGEYYGRENLIRILENVGDCKNRKLLENSLTEDFDKYWQNEKVYRYLADYAKEFQCILCSAELQKIINSISPYVYVKNKSMFLFHVLKKYFGKQIQCDTPKSEIMSSDCSSITISLSGHIHELKMSQFLRDLGEYEEVAHGYKSIRLFVEDSKIFVKIW